MGYARPVTLAAALALVAVSCSSSSASTSAPATASPSCQLERPATREQTFDYGGQSRSYLVDLPADYDGASPAPMVVDFHGFASSGPQHDANTDMGARGAARGYVVVTPTSTPPQWNAFSDPTLADDYGFVHALVADLGTRLCVDTRRIYAAGHSNGSAFAGFLVCKPPFVFAAVAMVSATTPSTCPDDVAPSVIAIAGTADPQVPYAGGTVGGSNIPIPPAAQTMAAYATRSGCNSVPTSDEPLSGVQRQRYTGCRDGTSVVLDTVVGGTHPWPGSEQARADPTNSAAGKEFDATSEILDFFDRVGSTPPR